MVDTSESLGETFSLPCSYSDDFKMAILAYK